MFLGTVSVAYLPKLGEISDARHMARMQSSASLLKSPLKPSQAKPTNTSLQHSKLHFAALLEPAYLASDACETTSPGFVAFCWRPHSGGNDSRFVSPAPRGVRPDMIWGLYSLELTPCCSDILHSELAPIRLILLPRPRHSLYLFQPPRLLQHRLMRIRIQLTLNLLGPQPHPPDYISPHIQREHTHPPRM